MITIIVPVYNVEKYLDACVESALQMKTPVEILLVDDGSTDESGRLCDIWAQKDSRVRVIHQENQGLSGARNTGIRNARGSHVLFLDSDDFLDPAATDRMLAHITPQTQVVMGLYNAYYEEDGRVEGENCPGFLSLSGQVSVDTFLGVIPPDGGSCFMIAWRFIVPTALLLERELLFFPGIYHEDEEWTSRLLAAVETVVVTHEYFYQYRQAREGSITAVMKPKRIFDMFTIIEKQSALLAQQPQGSPLAQYLQNRMGGMYLNNLLWHHSLKGEDRTQALALLRRYCRGCLGHMTGRLGKAARLSARLVGLPLTCRLLGLARKLKG